MGLTAPLFSSLLWWWQFWPFSRPLQYLLLREYRNSGGDSASKANLKNAYRECEYDSARSGTAIPLFDYPVDHPYYAYTGGTKTAGRGGCLVGGIGTTAGNGITLIVTKLKGTGSGGTLTIDVKDGTKSSSGTLAW